MVTSRSKNAPTPPPKANVATEPWHWHPNKLPPGQAVDVQFAFVIHRWLGSDPTLARKPAMPRFWLADDRVGVSCAIRAALFDGVSEPYPLPRKYPSESDYNQALITWEVNDAQEVKTVELFMIHFDDPDSWDFHHSIVWNLSDGGLSVTQLSGTPPAHPSEIVLTKWRG